MQKLTKFFKETKEYGVRYTLCWFFDLPFLFEESKNKSLKRFSEKAYSFCIKKYEESYDESYEEEEEYEWDNTPTRCGCTIFNDCRECGSYPICCRDA